MRAISIRTLALALACLVGIALGEDIGDKSPPRFEEGVHYQRIANKARHESSIEALMAKDAGRVQIVEFFSYACHWCNHIDERVEGWSKQKSRAIAFRRVPVMFRPTWRPLAKAYFVSESLRLTDKTHRILFEQVQVQHKDFSTDDIVRTFFLKEMKVPAEDFDTHYQAFSLNRDLENTNHLLRAYQIMAVPAFIVNGPRNSYSTSVARAGSEEVMLEVLDFLIEKEKSIVSK